MRRRDLVLAGGIALAVPIASRAQQSARPARIGYVSWFSSATGRTTLDVVRGGLKELGYVEGRNVAIEAFFTDGDRAHTREVLQALVREPVDVLVVSTTPAVHLAKEVTSTIPIVMAPVADPLATGLVHSLSHPGGNLTGLAARSPDLAGKLLQFMAEVKPGIRAIGFLGSAKAPNTATFVRETRDAANRIGLRLLAKLIDGPESITGHIFAAMKEDGAGAAFIQPIFTGHQRMIVPLAMTHRLPVIAHYRAFAEAGGLLTYGVNYAVYLRRAAYFVDRILKGAKPADLPVEQPTKFELILNLKTARVLGLTVPETLLARADEVIE